MPGARLELARLATSDLKSDAATITPPGQNLSIFETWGSVTTRASSVATPPHARHARHSGLRFSLVREAVHALQV